MSNYDYWNEDAIGYEDSISHHGILGQKWGVRRYQNEDGSLTTAGRKRYTIDKDKGPISNIKDYIAFRKQAKAEKRENNKAKYKEYEEEMEQQRAAEAERNAIRKNDISAKIVGSNKRAYGSDLSNEELTKATQRLLVENQYKQAMFKNRVLTKQLNEQDRTVMSKIASQYGTELTKEAAKYATKVTWSAIEKNLDKAVSSIAAIKLGDKSAPSYTTFGLNIAKPTHENPANTAPVFDSSKWSDIANLGVTFI